MNNIITERLAQFNEKFTDFENRIVTNPVPNSPLNWNSNTNELKAFLTESMELMAKSVKEEINQFENGLKAIQKSEDRGHISNFGFESAYDTIDKIKRLPSLNTLTKN